MDVSDLFERTFSSLVSLYGQDSSVLQHIVSLSACPVSVLFMFADTDDVAVKLEVARNPACSPELLGRLVSDHQLWYAVGSNSSASSSTLSFLFESDPLPSGVSKPLLFRRLAGNPSTPPHILVDFFTGGYDDSINSFAAMNSSLPSDVLVSFLEGVDVFSVRSGGNVDARVCAALLNPSVPADVLRRFSQSQDVDVLSALARNVSCPTDLLKSFLYSGDDVLVQCAAANPSVPADVLKLFVSDGWGGFSDDVVFSLVSNERCPSPVLFEVFSTVFYGGHDLEAVYCVCENAAIPTQLIHEALSDRVPRDVSLIAAQNPSGGPGVISGRLGRLSGYNLGGQNVNIALCIVYTAADLIERVNMVSSEQLSVDRALSSDLFMFLVQLAEGVYKNILYFDIFADLFSKVAAAAAGRKLFSSAQLLTLRKVCTDAGFSDVCLTPSPAVPRNVFPSRASRTGIEITF